MNILSRFYKKYEKVIKTFIFIFGFCFDIFLLPSVTNIYYSYIGIFYGILVGLLLIIKEVFSKNKESKKYLLASLSHSFFLGNLLSYVLVYYTRSMSLEVSIPLFLFLVFIIFSNEFFKTEKIESFIDLSLYVITVYLLTIFNWPLVMGDLNDEVFFTSNILAVLLSLIYITVFSLIRKNKKVKISIYIFSVLFPLLMSVFYYLGIIPAVPLALKEKDIYKSVARDDSGDYSFIDLPKAPVPYYKKYSPDSYLIESGGQLYFFSSVLTPVSINTKISNIWEHYDKDSSEWIVKDKINYSVRGGRKDGYRGYTIKQINEEGLWRVKVATSEKRTIGSKTFIVNFLK
jgi:MFS family permease